MKCIDFSDVMDLFVSEFISRDRVLRNHSDVKFCYKYDKNSAMESVIVDFFVKENMAKYIGDNIFIMNLRNGDSKYPAPGVDETF